MITPLQLFKLAFFSQIWVRLSFASEFCAQAWTKLMMDAAISSGRSTSRKRPPRSKLANAEEEEETNTR